MKKLLLTSLMTISLFCSENQNVDNAKPLSNRSYAPEASQRKVTFIDNQTLPSGFSAGLAWAQAWDNKTLGSTVSSKVEVDYLRLYGMYGNNKVLIASDEYDAYSSSVGALRSLAIGSFCGIIGLESLPGSVDNGILILDLNSNSDKLWHWWTVRPKISNAPDYAIIEAKVRLSGNACFQLGGDWHLRETFDYTPEYNVTIKEIGASDWYGPNQDWQIITFSSRK